MPECERRCGWNFPHHSMPETRSMPLQAVCGSPVLTDISTWDLERIRQELPPTVYSEGFLFFRNKQLARCRELGCGDIMARGYTMGISSQDTIFPFCNYWEPEYYLKSLSGAQRLLRPVSNYLNGNHDIELPVNTYSVRPQQVIRETQLSAL